MLRRNDVDSWDFVTRLKVFPARLQVQPNQISSLDDHLAIPAIFLAIIITELNDEVLQACEFANQGYEIVNVRVAKVESETLDGVESLGGAGVDEAADIVGLDGMEVNHVSSVVEEDLALEGELVMLERQLAGLAADVEKSWLRVATDEGVIPFILRIIAPWRVGRNPELGPFAGDFFHCHARMDAVLESKLPDNEA
jgi:hypothetical protein